MAIRAYLGVVAFFLVLDVASGYCFTSDLTSCLAPMSTYSPTSGGVDETFSESQLNEICRLYRNAKSCTAPFISDCLAADKLAWDVIDGMYGYLCGEGFDAYVRNMNCWSNKAVNASTRRCAVRLQQDIQTIMYTSDECSLWSYMDNYVDCVVSAVNLHCKAEAATVTRTFAERGFAPIYSSISCGLPITTIYIIVAVCVFVVFVAISAIIAYTRNKRRLQQPTHGLAAVPGSYPVVPQGYPPQPATQGMAAVPGSYPLMQQGYPPQPATQGMAAVPESYHKEQLGYPQAGYVGPAYNPPAYNDLQPTILETGGAQQPTMQSMDTKPPVA